MHIHVHVLMRNEKEERNKKARSNKQGKATQHTHGSHFSMYIHSHILAVAGTGAHYVGHMQNISKYAIITVEANLHKEILKTYNHYSMYIMF